MKIKHNLTAFEDSSALKWFSLRNLTLFVTYSMKYRCSKNVNLIKDPRPDMDIEGDSRHINSDETVQIFNLIEHSWVAGLSEDCIFGYKIVNLGI